MPCCIITWHLQVIENNKIWWWPGGDGGGGGGRMGVEVGVGWRWG